MKIVIYTQRVEVIESYNERRDCADQRIAEYITACGYLPLPMPNNAGLAAKMVEAIKPAGIVLTGGNSLIKYGGNAPERDAMDAKLLELAIEKQIPVYGFCRGMQSILDYFGSELVQVQGHVAVRHTVGGDICGEKNSYHNQACVQLKDHCGLQALAQSGDGVIEAVKHEKYPIIATMWHPERELPFTEADKSILQKLVGGQS